MALFVPRPPTRLNWSVDPSRGWGDRRLVTPGMARAGLDFNRRLYAPDSANTTGLFARPAAPAPAVYRPARGDYAYASSAAPPVAHAPIPVPVLDYLTPHDYLASSQQDSGANIAMRHPDFTTQQTNYIRSLNSDSSPDHSFLMGADYGPSGIDNPNVLADTGAQGTPGSEGDIGPAYPGDLHTESPAQIQGTRATQSTSIQSDNPLDQQQSARETSSTYRPPTSTERFYDRKFHRNDSDPETRMMARMTQRGAPNASPGISPVRFNNEVAGHSDWNAY